MRFYRRRLYDIYNFLARKKGCPVLSQDVHLLVADSGPKWRIELVGVSGVGKSFLSERLTERLAGPFQWPRSFAPSSPGSGRDAVRGELFQVALSKHVADSSNPNKKFTKVRRLAGVFEADRKWDGGSGDSPVIFASGLVQWLREELAELAEKRRKDFEELMSERLVIFCTSDNPGLRGTTGRIARGSADSSTMTAQTVRSRSNADIELHKFSKVVESHGVPVLRLNLDKPVDENVAHVAAFLQRNDITSPRIARWARKCS